MEIDEAVRRIVVRQWILIAICITVPVAWLLVTAQGAPATYSAQARILISGTVPKSSSEADATASQARALATSTTLVAAALDAARLRRDPVEVAQHRVTLTALGISPVAALSVTDPDPRGAQALTRELANQLVTFLNQAGEAGLPEVLKAVDKQLDVLAERRVPIALQAQANPKSVVAQNRLAGIDRLISDLSGDRNRLAIESATRTRARLVDLPALPSAPISSELAKRLVLVGLFGLVLGLLVAGIRETLRPTLAGATGLARTLGAPVLGFARTGREADPPVLQGDVAGRLSYAAARRGSRTVVLLEPGSGEALAPIAAQLERAVGGGAPAAAPEQRLAEPVTVPPRQVASVLVPVGSVNGGAPAAERNGQPVESAYPALRIRAVADEPVPPGAPGVAAVVLAPNYARLSAVTGVAELLAVTGWPLLGVIGVRRARSLPWRRSP